MTLPKILVGCPTSDYHEYCIVEYLKAIKSLTYKNFDVLLVDNSKNDNYLKFLKKQKINVIKSYYSPNPRKRIIDSRNVLRQYVLDNNYDYLLSLEQDVIPPVDIIEKLLSYKKKIISGVYCGNIKVGNKLRILPLIYKFPQKSRFKEAISVIKNSNLEELKKQTKASYLDMVKAYYTVEELEKEKSPTRIHSCGLGSVLIHKDVLNKVKFRYSDKYGGWDDVWFCDDAKKNKFEIYVDPSVRCKHLLIKRPWNWGDLLKNGA